MKRILFIASIIFVVSGKCYAQNIDTVSVSVTLRAQDWAWAVGKFGAGNDSLSRTRIRAINNPALQYYIGLVDGNATSRYTSARQDGKSILLDN